VRDLPYPLGPGRPRVETATPPPDGNVLFITLPLDVGNTSCKTELWSSRTLSAMGRCGLFPAHLRAVSESLFARSLDMGRSTPSSSRINVHRRKYPNNICSWSLKQLLQLQKICCHRGAAPSPNRNSDGPLVASEAVQARLRGSAVPTTSIPRSDC